MYPRFSVIVPAYDAENFIRRALESVKSQVFKNYELIVVCDKCSDNTFSIAREYTDIVMETTYGLDGLARNMGLVAATGEWVLFLDADDWFLHEYCFSLLDSEVGKLGEDVLEFSTIWGELGYRRQTENEHYTPVWCRAWRREFLGADPFSSARYGADTELFHRMIQNNPKARVAVWDMPIYYYNYMREGSLTWKMEKGLPL